MNIEAIVDELLQISEQNLNTSMQDILDDSTQAQYLKNLAQAFLEVVKLQQKNIKQIEELSKIMQNARHGVINFAEAEYNTWVANRRHLMEQLDWQRIEQTANYFQQGLNLLLDQQVITVYASISKRMGVEVYNIDTGKLVKPGISSRNQIVGKINPSLKKLKAASTLIQDFDGRTPEQVKSYKQIYIEALQRYYNTKNRAIYWKKNKDKFGAVIVRNKGDIAEAFLSTLFADKAMKLGKNMEGNIGRFAKLVAQVDNTSGLLLGDFESKRKRIQYAAKSYGASTVGLQQMIDLAESILSAKPSIYNIQSLRQEQKRAIKQSGLRNQLQEFVGVDNIEKLKNILIEQIPT